MEACNHLNNLDLPKYSLSACSHKSRLIKYCRSGFSWLLNYSTQRVEVMGAPYGLFVAFAIANSCLLPFIFPNSSGLNQPVFIPYLLATAFFLGFFLVIRDFWPKKLLKFLPLYWYFSLFYCLPFLAISMCLFTSCSIEWIIDVVLTIFILGVLVDWKSYIVMITSGSVCAGLSFVLFGDLSGFDPNMGNFPIMAYATIVALLVGAVFSRNKERVLMEKLSAFKALGETIAHEMRTPLSSINVSANGLKECLPGLVEGYEKALEAGISVPKISRLVLESAINAPERMRYTCASSLNTIDMILLQLSDKDWRSHFSICSIKDCIKTALNEYSFRENEYALVEAKNIEDHYFFGHKYLVIHILYNLLRNALTFIQSENKGSINIWTQNGEREFYLHFCDTAKGISEVDLPKLFDYGFSKRSGGSGVGLHYCKRMMLTMGGNITVRAVYGQYSEFVLHFKKAHS